MIEKNLRYDATALEQTIEGVFGDYGVDLIGDSYKFVSSLMRKGGTRKELLEALFDYLKNRLQDRFSDTFEEFVKKFSEKEIEVNEKFSRNFLAEAEGMKKAFDEKGLPENVSEDEVLEVKRISEEVPKLLEKARKEVASISFDEEVESIDDLNPGEDEVISKLEGIQEILRNVERLLDRGLEVLEGIREKVASGANLKAIEKKEAEEKELSDEEVRRQREKRKMEEEKPSPMEIEIDSSLFNFGTNDTKPGGEQEKKNGKKRAVAPKL